MAVKKKGKAGMSTVSHIERLARSIERPKVADETAGLVSTSITLPYEMLGELQRIGLERKLQKNPGTTVSAICREALTEWLERRKRP